ncbi:GNAT family N-acetyltransferase [Arthrobacter pityocampae]|uniref:GNAT family N-acetyltransferase n=1 Tax=Arthrobacter pityocampae TaxID=547334 RepID=A0A2S5IZ99_9MICC|nr:GNAT family N-acetyltransferase [Arthrobacter pityocampae]PPB49874.1 GNAT family N-acetyltransferase [Arthrobacter pityocampae]
MELHTDRLVLRDYTLEDFAAVHAFASDPRIATYVDWGPNTEHDTHHFLETCVSSQQVVPRTEFSLAITLPCGTPFGSVGLTVDEQHHGHLGYVVGAEDWAKGYATEAAARLLSYGQEILMLERIEATCRPANLASARVLEKIGMDLEGLRPKDKFVRGTWSDSLVFARNQTLTQQIATGKAAGTNGPRPTPMTRYKA